MLGRIHGSLLIGLSYGWWAGKHNQHYAHPNQPGRDPDIGGRAIAFTRDQARARQPTRLRVPRPAGFHPARSGPAQADMPLWRCHDN